MYLVLLQDGILSKHMSVQLDLWCHLVLGFLCCCFCLDNLCIGDIGVLKSSTTTTTVCCCLYVVLSPLVYE
jgi:hypothetical protein